LFYNKSVTVWKLISHLAWDSHLPGFANGRENRFAFASGDGKMAALRCSYSFAQELAT
jgi:hypothetical protein